MRRRDRTARPPRVGHLCSAVNTPVRSVLDTCPDYAGAGLVEGLFERNVDLRTPGRRSQTDLLAFVKLVHGTAVIAVEGKVDESFDDLVSTWNDHSPGKERRLQAFCATLGLRVADVGGIRYQLLHRTASAIYEAQRYRTLRAVMLVHSFSLTDASFHDLQAFAKSMGVPAQTVNSSFRRVVLAHGFLPHLRSLRSLR